MADAHELVRALREAAREAGGNAWAPHSGLRVGAALRERGGAVHLGCNVESDSYGLTQCAERNAVAAGIASGARPGEFDAILIYVPGPRALPPCGACRQVLVEQLAADALVVSCCDSEEYFAWRGDALLPDAFRFYENGPGSIAEK